MLKGILALPLVFILTLLLVNPYFSAKFPYTHDGENHLARFANYKVALREGQFPPRFAPNLMNHYGYPVFNYNYPLANLLSIPFSFLKINYEITFKVIAGIFISLGLMGVYRWLSKLKISTSGVIVGTLVYATSPFIWSTILYRGNIGEIMAWGILPWLFYLIESLLEKKWWRKSKWWLLPAFLLSHNIGVMFGIPILLLYALIRFKFNRVFWQRLGLLLGLSIALTLWFWLPAIAEKNLVNVGQVDLANTFVNHFPSFHQLIFSPVEFGYSYQGSIDTLSFSLGIGQWLFMLFGGLLLLKYQLTNKKFIAQNKFLPQFLISSGLLILFQLSLTAWLWEIVPLVSFIQFTWRLALFANLFLSGLAGAVWSLFKPKMRHFLIIVLVWQLLSLIKLKPVDYFHKTNIDYDAFSQSTTTNNENLPSDFTYQEISDWQPSAQILEGEGEIKIDSWSGSKRHYFVTTNSAVKIVEPTMNFVGWETTIYQKDSQFVTAYINDEQVQGRIAYKIDQPGDYEIISKFTQKTWARLIGNTVSAMALLVLIFMGMKRILGHNFSFYLSWKLGLILVAISAGLLLIYDPSFPYAQSLLARSGLPKAIYSWANFDGVHYLTIIEKGYRGTGLIQAFFPLYPTLVKGIDLFIHKPILSGLIINFLIGFSLLNAWQRLLKIEFNHKMSKLGIYILFLFPTAFFFNAFYSEALFLLIVIKSFLKARKGQWLRSGLWAALASATRLVGIFLVPALLIELWLQNMKGTKFKLSVIIEFVKKFWPQIIYISLGSLGLLTYMFYLKQNFGDPLYFYHVQTEFGGGRQESIILYPQVVWRYLKILWTARPINLKYYAYVQEFIFGTLGLLAIIYSWFKVRKSYVVFSLLVFILPTLTGTFSSMPRYFLASFSALLFLTQFLSQHKRFKYLWLGISTLFLIFNTILFIQGYWVA